MKITMKISMKIMGSVKLEHLCLRVKIYIKAWEWYIFQKKKKWGFDKWYICEEENIDMKIMGDWQTVHLAEKKQRMRMVHLPEKKMGA